MNEHEELSRPIDPTDQELEALTAGKDVEFGEPTRPRDVGEGEVEALIDGKDVRIDEFPTLKREEKPMALLDEETTESITRPAVVSDEEVEALREGKEIDLASRARVEAQY